MDRNDPMYGRAIVEPFGHSGGDLPGEDAGFWDVVGTSWREQNISPEKWLREGLQDPDPDWQMTGTMLKSAGLDTTSLDDFDWVRNQTEFDWQANRSLKQRDRMDYVSNSGRWFAPMLAALGQPENIGLMFVPLGIGGTAAKTFGRAAVINTAAEVPFEAMRQSTNPNATWQSGAFNIGAVGLLSGAMGTAVFKGTTAIRRAQINQAVYQLGNDMARSINNVTVGPASTGQLQGALLSRLTQYGLGRNLRVAEFNVPGTGGARFVDGQAIHGAIREAAVRLQATVDPNTDVGRLVASAIANDDYAALAAKIAERAPAAKSVEELFELAAPIGREFDNADETLSLLKTTLGSDRALDPVLLVNTKKIEQMWRQGIDVTQSSGNIPSLQSLGVSFRDVNDFQEFVMGRELAHMALGTDTPITATGFGAREAAARALAAESYLLNRTDVGKQMVRDFDSALMRSISPQKKGAIRKGLGLSAEAVERTIGDSAANVINRLTVGKTNLGMDIMLALSGDGWLNTLSSRAGRTRGTSVHNIKMQEVARSNEAVFQLRQAWADFHGYQNPSPFGMPLRAEFQVKSYENFIELATKTRMRGVPHENPAVNKAVAVGEKYFNDMEVEQSKIGFLGAPSRESLVWRQSRLRPDWEKADMEVQGRVAASGRRNVTERAWWAEATDEEKMIRRAWERVSDDIIEIETNGPVGKVVQSYMTRSNNIDAIEHYKDFYTDLVEQKLIATGTDPVAAPATAKAIVREIIFSRNKIEAPGDVGLKTLRQRGNPLEDKELIDVVTPDGRRVDFIDTNMDRAIQSYGVRTGAYMGYFQNFNQKTYMTPDQNFDAMVSTTKAEMIAKGATRDEANLVATNLRYHRDFEMHRLSKDPDSLDTQIVQWLKFAAYPATMVLSGLSQLPEFAMLMGSQGFMNALRPVGARWGRSVNQFAQLADKEARQAGLMNEATGGQLSNIVYDNPDIVGQKSGGLAASRDRQVDRLFSLNGVKALTLIARQLNSTYYVDAFMRGIAQIEGVDVPGMSVRSAKENAIYVNAVRKAGFSPSEIKAIAKELRNNGGNMYDPEAKMFYGNSNAWNQDLAIQFRSRLKGSVDSMVLIAHSTDKWKILNGVVHVRDTPLARKLTEPFFVPKSLKDSHKAFKAEEASLLAQLNDPNLPQRGQARTDLVEDMEEIGRNIVALEKKMDLGTGHGYLQLQSPAMAVPFFLMSFTITAQRRILAAGLRREFHAPFLGLSAILGLEVLSQALKKDIRDFGREEAKNWNSWETAIQQGVWRHSAFGLVPDILTKALRMGSAATGIDMVPESQKFGGPDSFLEETVGAVGGVIGGVGYNVASGFAGGVFGVGDGELKDMQAGAPFKQLGPMKEFYDFLMRVD